MSKSIDLYRKAKQLIPGGTQLLSKRPEMFLPDWWPAYYDRADGCQVWDLDGKQYTDMSYMGIGSNVLGYCDSEVDQAVIRAVSKGNATTLNAPEEVELAELLINMHPWADMVRYTRSGGEAMTVAVRIARAFSKKDIVLFCGYHGWHDWYLAANLSEDDALNGHLLSGLSPLGVPKNLIGTAFPFQYNDTKAFLDLIAKYEGKIGAVVMEPIRNLQPEKGFLETIREVTKQKNIPFICDEISAGFRMNIGGSHLHFGIEPDIAVFAKGISNGYPMAAIIGRGNIMQAAQESFISSTYWTDRIGPVAAIATIKKMQRENVPARLVENGRFIQEGWKKLAQKHQILIDISGIYPLGGFKFHYDNYLEIKTLFTQMMLERGFLATAAYYASYAHQPEHLQKYLQTVDEVFALIAPAIAENKVKSLLKGQVSHAGFKRLT